MICSVICLTRWSMNWISEQIILYQLILLVNWTEWFVHELDWFVRDSFISIAILSIFILIWTIYLFFNLSNNRLQARIQILPPSILQPSLDNLLHSNVGHNTEEKICRYFSFIVNFIPHRRGKISYLNTIFHTYHMISKNIDYSAQFLLATS